jgi:toxin ParE1/3/4
VKVRWTTQAEQDGFDIRTYIAAYNVRAAIATDELFGETASRLEDFPMLGKPELVAGTRELIAHESHRLIYEVDWASHAVWVLALVHTARQWPPVR